MLGDHGTLRLDVYHDVWLKTLIPNMCSIPAVMRSYGHFQFGSIASRCRKSGASTKERAHLFWKLR